jgi:glycerate kinase
MEAVALEGRVRRCDLAVTGEGSFDRQSLRGKVPAGVLRVASEARVPVVVLCGRAEAEAKAEVEARGTIVRSLAGRFGVDAAEDRAGPLLEQLAAEVASELGTERG